MPMFASAVEPSRRQAEQDVSVAARQHIRGSQPGDVSREASDASARYCNVGAGDAVIVTPAASAGLPSRDATAV